MSPYKWCWMRADRKNEGVRHTFACCMCKTKNILCICTKPSRRCRCHSKYYMCALHTYRMVGLKRLFNDHFILKMQKIEMKLFYFCFGCWANTTNYLLDRHGNYALSRCRMFWFMHKLCIVNVNKSMCSNTLGRKDTKKTRPLSALCAFFLSFLNNVMCAPGFWSVSQTNWIL